ncbi:MAG: DUF5320 domain-containing protein [Syntrophomonadaceae bacterium]|nr:DUF5320 domain-containing protein [Syntrophomonadaceae bacterium]
MPRRDGTGPVGNGPRTGGARGFCRSSIPANPNRGWKCTGMGRGFRHFGYQDLESNQKSALLHRKEWLEGELNAINRHLETP